MHAIAIERFSHRELGAALRESRATPDRTSVWIVGTTPDTQIDWPTIGPHVPAIVLAVSPDGTDMAAPPSWADTVLRSDHETDAAVTMVASAPLAGMVLTQILRGSERRSIDDGLLLESAAYSMLQAGPEFAAWRKSRPARDRSPGDDPPVIVERFGDELHVTLNRPHVRNALDRSMRDHLVEALSLAIIDDAILRVDLRGRGSAYSSGGDLDEFGSFDDPVSAHLVRTAASIGRSIDEIGDRVHVHLHGACFGSGIEIPAFARHVTADPDTSVSLPELSLGLIPGAGGTISLPRRIGRHRTAFLALTGLPIDGSTAHRWGLVDDLDH